MKVIGCVVGTDEHIIRSSTWSERGNAETEFGHDEACMTLLRDKIECMRCGERLDSKNRVKEGTRSKPQG